METVFTEREQIVETVNKLFVYTDDQKWTKLQEEVFTPRVELDMVSMGAEKIEQLSAREICYRWEKGFEDLDAVHHQAGNYIVNVDGEHATVSAYAIASHFKEKAKKGKTREFVGSYDLHLDHTSVGWRIESMKFNLKYSSGNLALE